MGLFDFFRQRRDRESALAAAVEIQSQGGSVAVGDTTGAVPAAPPLAPPGSVAGETGDWQEMLKGMASGQVSISQAQQSIDLRDVEGLRADVMAAMKAHGVDPEHPGAVDASQVAGLQEAVTKAMEAHGIDLPALSAQAWGAMQGGAEFGVPASAPVTNDAVKAQLQQLDRLRAEGALTDDEYRKERQKVLDQL
jgi:hypothetical protein